MDEDGDEIDELIEMLEYLVAHPDEVRDFEVWDDSEGRTHIALTLRK